MAMDLANSEVRFSISQLSKEQRFQLLSSVGGSDEDGDYSSFLNDILRHSLEESHDINDQGFGAAHPKVDHSEDEAFNADTNGLCLVEIPENEAFNAENEDGNEAFSDENEVLDYDDPLYNLFLSNVKVNGRSFTFEMTDENGFRKTIQYDREESIRKNRNKDNAEEGHTCEILNPPLSPDLKEKLMAILRKPFDEQEHNTLWHEVTLRRYKVRHRELKDGTEKSVRTKFKAKSYIQKHKAFRRAIKAVPEDKFRRLNILRGFAFWLQYLPGDGTFKPWEDASCLAVMPGSH